MAYVLVRCGDRRLNDPLRKKYTDATIVSQVGGIKWYLSRDSLEDLIEQLEIIVSQDSPTAIHLVSHGDCQLYQELGEDDVERYTDDLLEIADQVGQRFPEIDIATFWYDPISKSLKKIAEPVA